MTHATPCTRHAADIRSANARSDESTMSMYGSARAKSHAVGSADANMTPTVSSYTSLENDDVIGSTKAIITLSGTSAVKDTTNTSK